MLTKMQNEGVFSKLRRWRAVFFITMLLRVYFAISMSYIHPDEHFQGPEAVVDQIFDWQTHKSWEFTTENPARSMVLIWITCGLPMSFVSILFGTTDPMTLLRSIRLLFALASLVLGDMAIDRLSSSKEQKFKTLLFTATSYVTWVYQAHTFSNSVETVILLWCLVILHELENSNTYTVVTLYGDIALLGVLTVFGIFNRVTFVAYLFVPILQYFYNVLISTSKPRSAEAADHSGSISGITSHSLKDRTLEKESDLDLQEKGKMPFLDRPEYVSGLRRRRSSGSSTTSKSADNARSCAVCTTPSVSLITQLIVFGVSGAVTAVLIIIFDTELYGRSLSNPVIAPINSVLYNIDIDNLSTHGLHSNFTHLLENLPFLLGPGLLLVFLSRKYVFSLPAIAAISGLLILSLVPHQEARFLVPILPLACFCMNIDALPKRWHDIFFGSWFLFNLIMGFVMGTVHQGGVIKAQSFAGSHLSAPNTSFIWWRTYSPPVWIMAEPVNKLAVVEPKFDARTLDPYAVVYDYVENFHITNDTVEETRLLNLMGVNESVLLDISSKMIDLGGSVYLVCPSNSVTNDPQNPVRATIKDAENGAFISLSEVWHTSLHYSFETLDFGDWQSLIPGLSVWRILSVKTEN